MMKRKGELKGLLTTAKSCVEDDDKEGLKTVLENIKNIIEKEVK